MCDSGYGVLEIKQIENIWRILIKYKLFEGLFLVILMQGRYSYGKRF